MPRLQIWMTPPGVDGAANDQRARSDAARTRPRRVERAHRVSEPRHAVSSLTLPSPSGREPASHSTAGANDLPSLAPGTQSVGGFPGVRWAVVLLVGARGARRAQNGPSSCSISSQNLYVRDVMQDLYLWNQFLPDVNPTTFSSPEAYLEAVRYRPLDNRFSYITSAASHRTRSTATASSSATGCRPVAGRASCACCRCLPTVPRRGRTGARRRILEINGRTVAALVATGTIGTAFGADRHRRGLGHRCSDRREAPNGAPMVKRPVTIPTVSLTRVFDVDGRRSATCSSATSCGRRRRR